MDEITETTLLNPQNPQNRHKYKPDNSVNRIIASFGVICGTFIVFSFTFCITNIYTEFNTFESGFIAFATSIMFFCITFLMVQKNCFKQEDYDKSLADDNNDSSGDSSGDSSDDNLDNHEYSNYNNAPIENDNENKLIETPRDNSITIVYQDLEPMYKKMW